MDPMSWPTSPLPPSAEEEQVLEANRSFYEAFAGRDSLAMDSVWAKRSPVTCIHPGWQPLLTRAHVMKSWRALLTGRGAPSIHCTYARAYIQGETAFVICNERIPGGELCATNIFVREDGGWKLVHHQAGPISRGSRTDVPPPSLMN